MCSADLEFLSDLEWGFSDLEVSSTTSFSRYGGFLLTCSFSCELAFAQLCQCQSSDRIHQTWLDFWADQGFGLLLLSPNKSCGKSDQLNLKPYSKFVFSPPPGCGFLLYNFSNTEFLGETPCWMRKSESRETPSQETPT